MRRFLEFTFSPLNFTFEIERERSRGRQETEKLGEIFEFLEQFAR